VTDDFSRAGDVVGGFDLDQARYRYGVSEQEWPTAKLDEFVTELQGYPGGDWLAAEPVEVRRVYALSCIQLMNIESKMFTEWIQSGAIWDAYGELND
jgi:hypothetical protein